MMIGEIVRTRLRFGKLCSSEGWLSFEPLSWPL
jgi:hypothetical protein